MEFKRCSGILMPISSLPGGYGIGSMGKPAHDFVNFLAKAGQTIWQILPVGPTGYADSPYQSCSAFAGNPYFIDLDQLAADGLLKPEDYAKENWGTNPNYCDYALLYQKRYKVLRKAYAAFLQQRPVPGYDTPYSDDWYRFTFLSDAWLPDYCLYMAIKEENKMCSGRLGLPRCACATPRRWKSSAPAMPMNWASGPLCSMSSPSSGRP